MVKGWSYNDAERALLDYSGLVLGAWEAVSLEGDKREGKLIYLEGRADQLRKNVRQIDSVLIAYNYKFDFDYVQNLLTDLRSGKSIDENILKDFKDSIPLERLAA